MLNSSTTIRLEAVITKDPNNRKANITLTPANALERSVSFFLEVIDYSRLDSISIMHLLLTSKSSIIAPRHQ